MSSSSTTVACSQCGALNGAEFGRCIRCNQPLDGATPADKATRRVPAPRTRSRGEAVLGRIGPGSEPLLGRYDAEDLPAAKLFVFLNVVVLVGQLFSALSRDPSFATITSGGGTFEVLRYGGVHFGNLGLILIDPFMFRAEPWRLLSACYVHFGPLHLGMNMMGLIYLAKIAEPAIGSIRFIIAYTLSGIGGYAANLGWFVLTGSVSTTAGASGAVFGIMGVVLGFFMRRRDPRWKPWLGRAVIGSLAITFFLPMGINHAAHIGGLLTGVAVGALFGIGAPKPSMSWQRAVAALFIVGTLATLVAVRFSPYVPALIKASS